MSRPRPASRTPSCCPPNIVSTALVVMLVSAAILSCGSIPKPKALSAFEQLEKTSLAAGALAGLEKQDRYLLEDSQRAEQRAIEAWNDGDAALSKHHTRLAKTYLRQALARAELARTRTALHDLDRRVISLEAQDKQVSRHLSRVKELIALHEELAMAHINTREKAMHLSEVQKTAGARHLITEARLALKVAETVEAQRLAKPLHIAASNLIGRAIKLLARKKVGQATALARAAQHEAHLAYKQAKPRFLRDKKLASRRAENLALQQGTAAWAAKLRGASVRVGVAHSGQQLELRLTYLFPPGKTAPHKKKLASLDQLGAVLKRYPSYPVLIRGFTSHRTPRRRRGSVSRARANAVRLRLLRAGLSASRFVAEGAAASKLIGYKNSGINDRVELLIPLAADSISDEKLTAPTLTPVHEVSRKPRSAAPKPRKKATKKAATKKAATKKAATKKAATKKAATKKAADPSPAGPAPAKKGAP